MLSGSTADRLGRKRVFVAGLVVFSLASLLCSLAPNVELLVAFRVLQAVGGSMLNPVAMSIITNTFTDPRERAQAIGVWGAVFGISMALGPIVGGTLVAAVGWRSIFWINLPVGLAAIVLTLRFVPESRAPRPRRFDPVGQVLVIVLLAALTFGIIEAPALGWSSPAILAAFAASAAALAGLLLYEPRRDEPLIDLRFFRSIPFAAAIAISVAAFAAFGGFLFLNTLYLQDVARLSPLQAGLATLPMAADDRRGVAALGPHRRPPRAAAAAGDRRCLLVTACAMLSGLDAGDPARVAARRLRGLRARLRVGQRADHQRRRVRDAARPGRRRGGDRHDLAAVRPDARRRGRRRDRRLHAGGRAGSRRRATRLVDAHRLRRRGAGARAPGHHPRGRTRRRGAPRRSSTRRRSPRRLARDARTRRRRTRSGC